MIIENIKYFMIISGTWNLDWTENENLKTVQIWYRRFIGLSFVCVALIFLKLIQLIAIGAEIQVIYESASILITYIAVSVKILIYQYNNVSILFKEIIYEEENIRKSSNKNVTESYNNDVKLCKKLKNGLIYFTVLSCSSFVLINVLKQIKFDNQACKTEKQLIEHSFMYPMWFPYLESENMVSVVIFNIIILFTGMNFYVTSEIICYSLMIFAAAELKMLQAQIRSLISTDHKNINHYCLLEEIVKKHSFVLGFIGKLNNYTSYVMLTNFLSNSINVSAVTVEILSKHTVTEVIFPVMLLLHLLSRVFLLGWFSNEIMVQNIVIGELLYQIKWYKQDVKTQKLLIFMIRQTQQPLTLAIGPFGPMTLETALKTVQAAYSYVTLMTNI